jgi:hypothetical protein
MKDYYTYLYLREDNTPYYVGKGKNKRAYVKSKHGAIHPPKDKSKIVILHINLTEEQAFEVERTLISIYGRKDLGTGILHNRTDGGEGTSGHVKTQEWIDNHKLFMKEYMKDAPSPMAGKTQTKEHVDKRMKAHVGAKRSESTCKKIAAKATGRKQTSETIEKRILYVTCEHCNKQIDKGNYSRWHGDKCKERSTTR